jgi:hypothetical protein
MEVSELKQEIRNVFDPLANKLGLTGPVDMSLASTDFNLSYSTQEIGLELTVDMGDFFIYALIFRPEGSAPPIGYHDENGRRQKMYLQNALEELKIDVSIETRALQKLGGNFENCDEMTRILARLVQQYWLQISSNTERWFS